MRKETTLSGAIGKTLEGFALANISGQAVLTFSDGTFVTLGIFKDYYGEDDEIEETKIDVLGFGEHQLTSIGVISSNELEAERVRRNKTAADLHAKVVKQDYERLTRRMGADD